MAEGEIPRIALFNNNNNNNVDIFRAVPIRQACHNGADIKRCNAVRRLHRGADGAYPICGGAQ